MENQRIIIFFVLSFGLLMLWQTWEQDQLSSNPGEGAVTSEAPASDRPDIAQAPTSTDRPATPSATAAAEAPIELAAKDELLPKGQRIHVRTDVLDVEIDTIGGDIRGLALPKYPVSLEHPDEPFELMSDKPLKVFVAQSGLLSRQPAPDHHARFTADQDEYTLAPGQDRLQVMLHWRDASGITVSKVYTFHRDSYVIDLEQRLSNPGGEPWQGHQYIQLQRSRPESGGGLTAQAYVGGVIYSPEDKYQKISFDDMASQPLNRQIKGGWLAMIQHYFLGAWIPPSNETGQYYSKAAEGRPVVLGEIGPETTAAPNGEAVFHSRLYAGPKDQGRLEKVAEGLRLTVDYGILTVLAQPIFWLMKHIHSLVGNWGWTIIILTLIIKLAFYKLSEKSYRSMARMRTMTPKIASIRERYGDDRQRMSQAMMELYKKEKINPLGGCLPMLVQIPVFIALYWVLLESVEMRQAPFILWINDLSIRDPYYVLPLLMGISMFIQQKLNPAPPDPMQAKLLSALPFVFTLFFAFFPAGLVLYWVANSVLSIAQQWYITRKVEAAAANK